MKELELNAELEVSGKKRSLSVSDRPVQHVDSASKRSRISRVIRGAEELLASLNKDDGIEGELGNEENEDSTTASEFETPHSRRSHSMPGSRVVDKTPVRKSASVPKKSANNPKKGASSKPTTSKEARKGSSTTIDVTPNRLNQLTPLVIWICMVVAAIHLRPTSHVVALQVLPLKLYRLH